MSKFDTLRKEHPVFVFRSYDISESENQAEISFSFSIPGFAEFRPGWTFPKPNNIVVSGDPVFERLAFSLGMAEAVSYWKAVCSPEFLVECGSLNDDQKEWWKKLWFLGLGEFFYINGIEISQQELVNIVCTETAEDVCVTYNHELKGCLVPIGGGKDSALTLETLKNASMDCRCYAINKRQSISASRLMLFISAIVIESGQQYFVSIPYVALPSRPNPRIQTDFLSVRSFICLTNLFKGDAPFLLLKLF